MAIVATVSMQPVAIPFRERILLVALYVAVLASSVAFIEPSPHDGLMGVLAIACLVAGVRFERKTILLFLLLLIWNVAGLLSLLNRPAEPNDIQYAATSIYLAIAAIIFACLFAENTMQRLGAMRAAYVLTATIISFAGIAGYFHLFPGAYDLFAPTGRALGGFKDPNVFGPFLIWPALVVLERMVARRIRITDILVVSILLLGLLLSFSRGAWFHFAVSGAVMIALAFLTAPTPAARVRIFGLSVIVVVGLAAIFALLLSFDSIGTMFRERAQVQAYDLSEGGRFQMQEFALAAMLEFPNGMGPYGFSAAHGLQQHNVYLQAFMVYGWIGGMDYFILLLSTLWIGVRTVLIRTPWQPYLITALAAFVGEIAEGFVIDTDHWRHFFLLLGMIWGLAAATFHHERGEFGLKQP
jgi:O-antigen ligase/polysaccharide polymerase Wzy-like membrane protein